MEAFAVDECSFNRIIGLEPLEMWGVRLLDHILFVAAFPVINFGILRHIEK